MKRCKRLLIAILSVGGIYIVYLLVQANWIGEDGGDTPTATDPQRVFWRQPYWLLEDETNPDEETPEVIENEILNDGVRIYPYKSIKSEILSIRRRLKDTRPQE